MIPAQPLARPAPVKPVVDTPWDAAYRCHVMRYALRVLGAASIILVAPVIAYAQSPLGPSTFSPRVPVSSFAQPKFGIDMSRLNMSTSFSVGSGFNGGSSALQVTRFSYQFRAPVWMSVSVGNVFGGAASMGNAFFLEGLDFAWRPNPNMTFQVHYQDVRSPLQYRDTGFGLFSDPYRAP